MQGHFDRLLELIETEHRAEAAQNRTELARLPARVREALGKSVTRLSAESSTTSEGGYPILTLSRQPAGEELSPFHAMSRGDLVCAESPTGQRYDGTLDEVDEYRADAAMTGRLPDPLPRGRWTLHLIGSDATYRRMRRALDDVKLAQKKPVARLRDVSFAKAKTGLERIENRSFFNPTLNAWQKKAVSTALQAKDLSLIHGPPGTGKTTALVEIIRQAVRRGERVLATAPSNIAVDNILEKLLDADLRVVRLGHPARTMKSLRHATLAVQILGHPDTKKIRDLDLKRERLMLRRSRRADRGQLGYDERHERQQEIRELWRQARDLEKSIARELLQGAQVVLSTHGALSRPLLREPFGLAVLDEASQAVEPLSWIPLLQAKKAVLAGDPLQLAPTLYSQEAAKAGLAVTLFERLQKSLPKNLQTMLRVQYRMHEAIMGFPSKEFYEGKLVADVSVCSHLACDLPRLQHTLLTGAPVHFIDTAGTGYGESWDELLQSRENPEEAGLASRILDELLQAGLSTKAIAIITPYVAQVKRFKAMDIPPDLEVGTVDGFQGREKEAVIVSLVRSNDRGEVGFLEDSRRMNVAVTRARRLLIVLGDSATIANHPLYARFIEYAQSLQAHRSAWDWIKT